MAGPLQGLKVIEMSGDGAAPFGVMLLADMGATVLRVQPLDALAAEGGADILARGRQVLPVDLSHPMGVQAVLQLIQAADVLIEGYMPGVMEAWGLDPETCLARNPRLVYARVTGWGQHGPLAQAPGCDINHIALSGVLHAIGRERDAPVPPLNLIGDGGGGMLLTLGVLAALYEVGRSGFGQVVDAASTEATALLACGLYGLNAEGRWSKQRGENLLDGGAPFYDTYACADGKYVAIGAVAPGLYARLLELCGIQDAAFDMQMDTARWPMLKLRMADVFLTKTRDEWCRLLEGSQACFAPVLDCEEAPLHPHNQARTTFVTVDGVVQPAPAPRFSRTPSAVPARQSELPLDSLVQAWGISDQALASWRGSGVVGRVSEADREMAVKAD